MLLLKLRRAIEGGNMQVIIAVLLSFLQSKRFWMSVAALAVPIIAETFNLPPDQASHMFWVLVTMIIGDTVRPLQPKEQFAFTRALLNR